MAGPPLPVLVVLLLLAAAAPARVVHAQGATLTSIAGTVNATLEYFYISPAAMPLSPWIGMTPPTAAGALMAAWEAQQASIGYLSGSALAGDVVQRDTSLSFNVTTKLQV